VVQSGLVLLGTVRIGMAWYWSVLGGTDKSNEEVNESKLKFK